MIDPTSPGAVLVAPCTFNSLNKLGVADTLALSIVAEAIGRRQQWPWP